MATEIIKMMSFGGQRPHVKLGMAYDGESFSECVRSDFVKDSSDRNMSEQPEFIGSSWAGTKITDSVKETHLDLGGNGSLEANLGPVNGKIQAELKMNTMSKSKKLYKSVTNLYYSCSDFLRLESLKDKDLVDGVNKNDVVGIVTGLLYGTAMQGICTFESTMDSASFEAGGEISAEVANFPISGKISAKFKTMTSSGDLKFTCEISSIGVSSGKLVCDPEEFQKEVARYHEDGKKLSDDAVLKYRGYPLVAVQVTKANAIPALAAFKSQAEIKANRILQLQQKLLDLENTEAIISEIEDKSNSEDKAFFDLSSKINTQIDLVRDEILTSKNDRTPENKLELKKGDLGKMSDRFWFHIEPEGPIIKKIRDDRMRKEDPQIETRLRSSLRKVPNGRVYIYSNEDHYFYAAQHHDGDGRRSVHTWTKEGSAHADPQAKWNLRQLPSGEWSIEPLFVEGEYLYATLHQDVYSWKKGGSAEGDIQGRWRIKPLGNGRFAISIGFAYLYAAQDSDGAGGRFVHTGSAAENPQAHWKIVPCESNKRPRS